MNESGERLNRAAAKAALYSLLAQALNYPEKDLVDNLCQGGFLGEIMDALDVLGIEGLRSSLETFQKEYTDPGVNRKNLLLEIEKDYTWMCFASKPRRLVYLFESVYNEGKLFDESTFQIARLYYEAGLKVEESFRLPQIISRLSSSSWRFCRSRNWKASRQATARSKSTPSSSRTGPWTSICASLPWP